MKKNLVIFLTSGFSKASLNLYSPQVLLTWQPNPAGQFLEISNPAGQFLAVSNLAGYFIDVFQENIFFCSLENISKSKKFFGPKKIYFLTKVIWNVKKLTSGVDPSESAPSETVGGETVSSKTITRWNFLRWNSLRQNCLMVKLSRGETVRVKFPVTIPKSLLSIIFSMSFQKSYWIKLIHNFKYVIQKFIPSYTYP